MRQQRELHAFVPSVVDFEQRAPSVVDDRLKAAFFLRVIGQRNAMPRVSQHAHGQGEPRVCRECLQQFDDAGFVCDPVAVATVAADVLKIELLKFPFWHRCRLAWAVIGNGEALPRMQVKRMGIQVVLTK